MLRFSVALFLFLIFPCGFLISAQAQERIRPGQSVVRIEATGQVPDYTQPWAPGRIRSGVGSGFVIKGDRILTNAHVVSHARFVRVSKQGDPKPYPATVEFVAHDCDLALLRVYDETFFKGMVPLPIGGIPALESTVSVFGYPIGGDRISVTQGVVSRIDFLPYSHTGIDAHLTIQIDAAINPGNSGGPVLQGGKVVGVAFQGFRGDVAQNVGYMIPTPVIQRFLKDIESGSYDHYMDLAITYSTLFNPTARKVKGIADHNLGVLVGRVFGQGSADGYLQSGDVLLKIDGHPIASDGSVELDDENVALSEVVERKFLGDTVSLEILREGEISTVEMPLKPFPYDLLGRSFREQAHFVSFAGLVFQPVDQNLMQALTPPSPRLQYLFNNFLEDGLYEDRPEIIILSSILADPVNTFAQDFRFQVLDSINGQPVRSLDDVASALAEPEEYTVFRFLGEGRPLVLERSAVEEAAPRIAERYRLNMTQFLEP
jgi:S1-C subfamily serine protease